MTGRDPGDGDQPRRASRDRSGRFPAESGEELPWSAFADTGARRASRVADPASSPAAGAETAPPMPVDDAPPTMALPLGEITSRRARRLAEQAAAEAAARVVSRSDDPAPPYRWTEDTMPLPRIGRHAGVPTPPDPAPGTPSAAASTPARPTRAAAATTSAATSPTRSTSPGTVATGDATAPMTRAQLRARQREAAAASPGTTGRAAVPPAAGVPGGSAAPRPVVEDASVRPPVSRPPAVRDLDAAPRHEARGLVGALGRRRGRLVAVTAALLVVAVVTGVVLVKVLTGGGAETPPAAGSVADPQDTLLVALGPDGAAGLVTATIMGVGKDGLGAVLVPGTLMVEIPGAGRRPLSSAPAQGPDAAASALTDALDVRIDGTWSLSASGLSALVDALGGVFVDVDHQVVSGTTVVAAGPGQRLAGVQAVAVAMSKGDDEAEEARLARFGQVWRGVLRALPESTTEIAPLVASRAGTSQSTLAADRLADLLLRAHRAVVAGTETASVLPLKQISTGGPAAYSLDEAAVPGVLASQLPGALRAAPSQGAIGVRLLNGVGKAGLNDAARDRLAAAGIRVESSGNAPEFGHATTQVLVRSADAADQERGRRIAVALGLPKAQIAVDELGSATADAIVVLGQDFVDDLIDNGVTGKG